MSPSLDLRSRFGAWEARRCALARLVPLRRRSEAPSLSILDGAFSAALAGDSRGLLVLVFLALTLPLGGSLALRARQLQAALRPDGSVEVVHHPSRPARAYLTRPGLIGMLFTAAALAFCARVPWMLF